MFELSTLRAAVDQVAENEIIEKVYLKNDPELVRIQHAVIVTTAATRNNMGD